MPPRTPIRRRIVADVISAIEAGELRPGDKLPSQPEMAATYECSLEPVKAALDELEARGYVEGHQGKGTFVADRSTPETAERPTP